MIGVKLVNPQTGIALHVQDNWSGEEDPLEDDNVLEVVPTMWTHSVFKAVSRTTAGTTTVVTPDSGGSIIMVDVVLSAERVNGGSVTLQFTDDTETEVIFSQDVTDAPVSMAFNPTGRWQGWRDARLDLVVVGNVTTTVATSYVKVKGSNVYSRWEELR